MNFIDNFLNTITMYRLTLYFLIILLGFGVVLSVFGLIPFNPFSILFSTFLLVAVCYLSNTIFSKVFNAPANIESVYITALILALIIAPGTNLGSFLFVVVAGILSMASKYILAINHKHLFNPAAIAVVLTALFAGSSANWWVGTFVMLPFVIAGGLLIARKTRREDMVFGFLLTSFITIVAAGQIKGSDIPALIKTVFFDSPIFFFAFIMLTEPLTSPPTKKLQIYYASLVGFLFTSNIHIGNLYFTPELALIAGNIFSYLVSPKEKLILKIQSVTQTAPDTFDFIFPLTKKITYQPGQYMEWTLPHDKADNRGNRRYFTLASSPTEDNLRIGVKFNHPSSSFKTALIKGSRLLVAGQRAGEFTFPPNPKEKLVFIAGGIGVTPFRSMLKYLIDKNERRDIILLYSNKKAEDIVYQDIFREAKEKLNIKVIYTITDDNPPFGWSGKTGRIDQKMIREEVPDFLERKFYLSGPHAMVEAFKKTLKVMGVSKIKEDYFPGFV